MAGERVSRGETMIESEEEEREDLAERRSADSSSGASCSIFITAKDVRASLSLVSLGVPGLVGSLSHSLSLPFSPLRSLSFSLFGLGDVFFSSLSLSLSLSQITRFVSSLSLSPSMLQTHGPQRAKT